MRRLMCAVPFVIGAWVTAGCGGTTTPRDDAGGGSDSGFGGIDCSDATASMGRAASSGCSISGCHNPDFAGQRMGLGVPSPNLTPDATGLMAWTTQDIATATLDGVRPDGTTLCTSMVRYRTAGMTEAEACDIAAYLQSLAPIANAVPDGCM